jgi:signal transduction histidine kinase/ligand-binding sensor domain-containing protein
MGKGHRQTRAIVGLGILLACCACAFALNPSLEVSQYAHTAWKVRDGFVKGAIFSIAQTPDGYLWLGTEFGLARFDGIRAVPWQPPAGEHLPNNFISTLLVARDGALWIGTHKGLARWKEGKLTNYPYPEFVEANISALVEGRDGTVWIGAIGTKAGSLCAAKGNTILCYGARRFGRWVGALYEDHKGNLWVSAETGLWRWAPGTPEHYSFPRVGIYAWSLIEDDSGAILISTNNGGLERLVGRKIEAYALPVVAGQVNPGYFLRSMDGGLWVGSQQGLFHLHLGRVDRFAAADGLSDDLVHSLFEDREGNIWIGTGDGLDRFHGAAVPTISQSQGLLHSAAWSVQATPDGSIWIATADGLNRWESGHVTVYRARKAPPQNSRRDDRELGTNGQVSEISNSGLTGDVQSLGQDDRGRLWASTSDGVFYFEGARFVRAPGVPGGYTYAITGDGHGNVWISNLQQGLFSWTEGSGVQRIPWLRFGQKRGTDLLPDPRGGLWLGFHEGGVAYLENGQVRSSYNTADGLGNSEISLRLGSRGELWAATEGGLSRIKDGNVTTMTSKNGLPCDAVHWSMEDDDKAVWLYMPCGLVRIARSELDVWVSDKNHPVQTTIFDIFDGVRTLGIPSGYLPHVTKSPDGKIWFTSRDGVSVIDPRHLPFNRLPPPVHVEQIVADRKTYWQNLFGNASSSPPKLPPLIRDLEIDYTALSLGVPEKVRFRVKLEGWDRDWKDAGTERKAFYSNLPPRNYRFRVIACNNSGVWNEAGDTLAFSIDPAYYQTTWFRVSCVAVFLVLLWGIYRLRVQQLQHQFAIGLEARVNERTRIARDLHDTLLQSFHGLILRFQAATNLLPERPVEAKQRFESAIDQAAQAVTEGRDAVQGLRSSTVETNDLAMAISALGEELQADGTIADSALFRMAVEGTPRNLRPILRDEVYRIAGETLRNAFRHAQARQIEVEIHYDARQFRLRVRDDGKGIDPEILGEQPRPGHFGLHGMRERAKIVGGQLDVWSELDSGTEIELSIPASRAYATPSTRPSWWSGKGSEMKS